MSQSKQNLVLTLAHGYKWPELSVFVNSLSETGFNGDLVIFTSRTDRKTIAMLKQKGVTVRPVFLPLIRVNNVFLLPGWAAYRALFRIIPCFQIKRFMAKWIFNIMCARFAHFHDYLSEHIKNYDKVLICDIRDVCFQSNPFQHKCKASIISFLEEGTIRNSRMNLKWIRQAVGEDASDSLMDKNICCAGVTIGKSDAILDYLDKMLHYLFRARHMASVAGVDQGLHNYLFHDGHLKNSETLENGNTYCMTLGNGKSYDFDYNKNVVMNGNLISILHQYDRHQELNKMINSRYRL